MSQILTISDSDIIHSVKLSYQIPAFIEAIASQKIITQAAQEAGIKVQEEELQQEGDSLRLAQKLVKAKDTWTWLENHHISVKEFEELVHGKVVAKKLANHLFSHQIEKFFYGHKLDYLSAITYQVMFDNRDVALEMFCALDEGEITFPEIARLYIEEPELRRTYGYQGLRHRKDFRPEIAAAVFAASNLEILKPITTPKGVHLIWVEEIFQPQLDEQLREKIVTELFSDWLKQEIECMKIVTQLDSYADLQLENKSDFSHHVEQPTKALTH